ncbi:MAG: hypothetical protein EOO88_63230 [Pedobacter sp.]|nr:MAG: hypothetical protein EOO88_63230 [Pedobacter sp.]
MKKIYLITFSLLVLLFVTTSTNAQVTPAEFYVGKWDVLAKGLPQGDTHLYFTITQTDGKLGGLLRDSTNHVDIPFTKTEVDAKGALNVGFSAQGYDVTVWMEKKDEDNIAGSMMSMFECTGVRMKP